MREFCCGIRCEVLSGHARHLAGVEAAALALPVGTGYGLQTTCLKNIRFSESSPGAAYPCFPERI
jgi:hypothetical protein